MLNLRQIDTDLALSRADGTTHWSTIRFDASIIVGNMGEPLDFRVNGDDGDSNGEGDGGKNEFDEVEIGGMGPTEPEVGSSRINADRAVNTEIREATVSTNSSDD